MNRRLRVLLLLAIATGWGGCDGQRRPPPAEEVEAAAPVDLTLLVVDDRPLGEAVARRWSERGEGELEVRYTSAGDLLGSDPLRLEADLVIYPSALLGELADRKLLATVPQGVLDDANLAWRDVFELIRLRETSWGRETLAVTFGSPTYTLIYRADVFAARGWQPPATWKQYQELVAEMQQLDAQGLPPLAALEPLAPGWAGQTLLARAAAYAAHPSYYSSLFDYRTMEPRIAGAPFVRALEELVAATGSSRDTALAANPAAAWQALLAGQCLMALAWPSAAGTRESESAVEPTAVAFAEMPGSADCFHPGRNAWDRRAEDVPSNVTLLSISGRLGSVVRNSSHQAAAMRRLVLLAGKQWGGELASRSPNTTLFRLSQIPEGRRWVGPAVDEEAARSYAELVRQALGRSASLSSPRLPGRQRYLDALDAAVRAAVAGEKTPQEALDEAAQAWREITDAIGAEQQAAAYRHSLGL